MGYTNYWRQKTDIPQGKWKIIKEEYEEYVKPVAGDLIEDSSSIDNIVFDGSCENFFLYSKSNYRSREKLQRARYIFHFCKTRGAKYDLAVWYLLTFINRLCPEIHISRDLL